MLGMASAETMWTLICLIVVAGIVGALWAGAWASKNKRPNDPQ